MLFEATGRTQIDARGEPVYHAKDRAAYRHVNAHDVGNGLVVLDHPTSGVVIAPRPVPRGRVLSIGCP